MKFEIKNRFTGSVIFTAELSSEYEAKSYSVQLGAAVKLAVNKARAYLAGANLADANLADANLARANLAGAYLAGANLADANLADANLADANLADANLARANLAGAYLADANLAGAYLADANLARANLARANLADADGEKLTLVGKRPVIWYGPVGSESRTVYAFLTGKGVYVRAGCFWDTMENFKAAVTDTHGGSDHGTEYQAFIELAETHFKLFGEQSVREAAE